MRGKGRCSRANSYIRLFCFSSCYSHELNLVDFSIIQTAITIAVHLPEHGDDTAVELGFVDHAVGVKIEHLKPFILAAGEFFKVDNTIIVDVELFCH